MCFRFTVGFSLFHPASIAPVSRYYLAKRIRFTRLDTRAHASTGSTRYDTLPGFLPRLAHGHEHHRTLQHDRLSGNPTNLRQSQPLRTSERLRAPSRGNFFALFLRAQPSLLSPPAQVHNPRPLAHPPQCTRNPAASDPKSQRLPGPLGIRSSIHHSHRLAWIPRSTFPIQRPRCESAIRRA